MKCRFCGKEFESKAKGTRFCSLECRDKHTQIKKKNERERKSLIKVERKCLVCGNVFEATSVSTVKTCGKKCAYKLQSVASSERNRRYPTIAWKGSELSLNNKIAQAKALGMSYGEYVAMERRKEVKVQL